MMQLNETEILLVEDNPHDAEMTIRAMKKYNLANKLVHLTDGEAALDFLLGKGKYAGRELLNNPRLVLLDLKMPKVDGIEVLRAIRANESTKMIPVVVLTSSKEDPDIAECYRLGVNSYVVKPVDFGDFIKAVTELGLYWLLLNQPPE
jgi:two-component system response regulator